MCAQHKSCLGPATNSDHNRIDWYDLDFLGNRNVSMHNMTFSLKIFLQTKTTYRDSLRIEELKVDLNARM